MAPGHDARGLQGAMHIAHLAEATDALLGEGLRRGEISGHGEIGGEFEFRESDGPRIAQLAVERERFLGPEPPRCRVNPSPRR